MNNQRRKPPAGDRRSREKSSDTQPGGESGREKSNKHEGHRERFRERFRANGLQGFADHEALELILYYALSRKNTNQLGHLLLETFGSLSAVLEATYEELRAVDGIGEVSATLFLLINALHARRKDAEASTITMLDSTERAGAYFRSRFAHYCNEALLMVSLNAAGHVISHRVVSEGTAWSVAAQPNRIAEIALRSKAAGVIVAHNHPSGLAAPSPEDRDFTARIQAALETLEIELTDHIIVAGEQVFSFSEHGLLGRR